MFLEHFKVVRLPLPGLGMMHYWDGAHLALTSHALSTCHPAVTWVTLWVTPPSCRNFSVLKGIRGNSTHAPRRPQRHQSGACVLCKLSFMNEKWGDRKCSRSTLQKIAVCFLFYFVCVTNEMPSINISSSTYRTYDLNRIWTHPSGKCWHLQRSIMLHRVGLNIFLFKKVTLL